MMMDEYDSLGTSSEHRYQELVDLGSIVNSSCRMSIIDTSNQDFGP
jgi:hypothetical protein